jgi:arylsulfatase A-like enzyme
MRILIAKRAFWLALATTLLLAGLPLLVTARASFLGKDVTALAAGLLSFYPWVAVTEALSVCGAAFAAWWLAWGVTLAARQHVVGAPRLVVTMSMPVAYGFWFAATLLTYPAIFVEFTPVWLELGVYRAAFWLSPLVFYWCAGLLAALPVVVWLVGRWRWHKAAVVAAMFFAPVILSEAKDLFAGKRSFVSIRTTEAIADATPRYPNILIIGIDSLRADRMERQDVTPALQELRADPRTVNFEDHYIGIPRTFPSWIELLTGRYAPETGVRHMFPGFGVRAAPFEGLVTRARAAGYQTSVVSDFAGDVFPRFEAGFQHVDAPHLTLATMIRMSIDQAMPAFLPLVASSAAAPMFPAMRESPAFADPARLRDAVVRRIDSTRDHPWLLTAFFSTAHFPYAAPHPYYTRFTSPQYRGSALFQKNPDLKFPDGGPPAEDVTQIRGLYDGALLAIDSELAKLFHALKATGQWDNTLIVVTGDHGEDLFENGLLQGHGEHLRGVNVLRVPWLMKLPVTETPAVRRVTQTSRIIDVAPTVTAIAGLVTEEPVGGGFDWSPYLRRGGDAPDLDAYAETGIWFAADGSGFFQERRLHYPGIAGLLNFDQGYSGEVVLNPLFEPIIIAAKHRMLISGDDKLIYQPTENGIVFELYDRRADPDNLRDISAAEPERLGAMKLKFFDFVRRHERQGRLLSDYVVPR